MRYIEIENKAAGVQFFYSEEIELMLAVVNILNGGERKKTCIQVYGEEFLEQLCKKYVLLTDVITSFRIEVRAGMMEYLNGYSLEEFRMDAYEESLIHMEKYEFFEKFFDGMDCEKLMQAVNSEDALRSFYEKNPDISSSYLALHTFFYETDQIIHEFFAFAKQLRTESFLQVVNGLQETIDEEERKYVKDLEEKDPLEYSQQLMGKTFYHRGPFSTFIFMPSYFTPYRCVRFYGENQILFYSMGKSERNQEFILQQLKTIADPTRFQIISVLTNSPPLRGMDFVKKFGLAASTVSHHMEQLKSSGLIHEEQVKNSKYYSVNQQAVRELLQLLEENLGKQNGVSQKNNITD